MLALPEIPDVSGERLMAFAESLGAEIPAARSSPDDRDGSPNVSPTGRDRAERTWF